MKIPKSFDVIGDILLFQDFSKELIKKEKQISNYLLKKYKNIKVVARKTKKYSGKYRLPKIKIIAGEKRKETLHKENNCVFKLDIEKCYFTPRLANERLRISKLIKNNESILVLGSGMGVYPIVISKNSKAKEVYGIEINPIAHKYALENIKLNKTYNIILLKGDIKKIIPKIKKKFDRIIIPIPKNATFYLKSILKVSKKNTIIHLYDFSKEKDIPKSSINKIKKYVKNFKALRHVKCGQSSPRIYRVCIDFKLI